jgi:mannose-6-phosphate isomerase-like protein (cupin superfamily)
MAPDTTTVMSLPYKASQTPSAVPSFSKGDESNIGFLNGRFTNKLLRIKKGKSDRLHVYSKRHEIWHVIVGRILFTYDDGTGNLKQRVLLAGDRIEILPGAVHQEMVLDDTILLEISTQQSDGCCFVEDRYGMAVPEGVLSLFG